MTTTPGSRSPIPMAAYAPMMALEAYTRTRVPASEAHLVRLRTSALNGCRYCLVMHRRDARSDGWTRGRITAVEHWTSHPELFDDAERIVLALTDAVTHLDPQDPVPDALWDEAVRIRGRRAVGHLLMEIVKMNAWNRIGIATRLDPHTLRKVTEDDLRP